MQDILVILSLAIQVHMHVMALRNFAAMAICGAFSKVLE